MDLVFSTNWSECGLVVTDLVSFPLSWSDHHLVKCNVFVALPPHREQGPISMVHPQRLLDPVGFQDAMRGVTADLASAPVNALVDSWSTAATRAIDRIVPKRLLHHRTRPAPCFNQELRALKRHRRRLECNWRRTPTVYNSGQGMDKLRQMGKNENPGGNEDVTLTPFLPPPPLPRGGEPSCPIAPFPSLSPARLQLSYDCW